MSEMFRFQLEIQTGTFGTPLAEYCSGVSSGFLRESQTDFYASLALIVESSLLGGLSVQFLRVLLGVHARAREFIRAGQPGGEGPPWLRRKLRLASTHLVRALASSPLVLRKSRVVGRRVASGVTS